MEQDGGAPRNSSSSSDSSFLAEREDRVRARSQARHADEAVQMHQIVFGTLAMSLGSSGGPRSTTSSHLLQQSQLSPFWRSPQQSEEPQQGGYRNGLSYGFTRNYSMSEGQQMAERGYGQDTSPFSRNNHSLLYEGPQQIAENRFGRATSPFARNNHSLLYEGPQQGSEGGYRDAFSSSFSFNNAFLSDGRHQMAEGDYGQDTSPYSRNNHSLLYDGPQQGSEGGTGFGGASLLSPGRFGSSADWTPTRPPRDFVTASRHTDHSTSIEFVPDHPPSSLPLERPAARGPALIVSSASYTSSTATRQQWRRAPPQPLLQLQMQHPGLGAPLGVAAAMLMPGPMVNVSCRTGRITVAPPPSPDHAFINSLPPHVRAQWARDQTAPPARRARPSTSSHSSSHRRNSSSSNDSSMGSGGSRKATECNYCLSVRKPAHGHNKYNCPVLADLPPCPICGSSGKDNHTASHCPHMAKTELIFVPKEKRVRNHTI